MPRTNTNQELFLQVNEVAIFRRTSGGGSTTSTTAATAGATAISWATNTSFTTSDNLIIASANFTEMNLLATNATNLATLTYKLGKAVEAGASIYEATKTVLGYIDESGVQMSPTFNRTAVRAANASLPIYYIPGEAEIAANFNLLGFNGLNLQTIFGIPESELGTGTSADPYQVAIGGTDFGTEGITCIRMTGTLVSGQTVLLDFNNATMSATGQVQFNRQAPAALPAAITCSAVMMRVYS